MSCRKVVKKLINIIKGHWYNLFNKKATLSKKRMQICNKCPDKVNIKITEVCGLCGCPLSAKTRVDDEKCEKNKW